MPLPIDGDGAARVTDAIPVTIGLTDAVPVTTAFASTLRPGDSCATEALRTFFR